MVHLKTIKISPAPQMHQKSVVCWCSGWAPGGQCSNVMFSNTWWLGGSLVLCFPILLARSPLSRGPVPGGECSNVTFSNTWWLGGLPVLLKAAAMSPCPRHLSWMRCARPAMQVVGVSAACRRARSVELALLISRGGAHVTSFKAWWLRGFHAL